jgi:hypothetical protein
MRKTVRFGARRCALMAAILLVAGIDIAVRQGQTSVGAAILAFAAIFAVLAVLQWRRGLL